MKPKWIIPDEPAFIQGLPALTHSVTNELCVFANEGELYRFDEQNLRVLINASHKKALKTLAKIQNIETPKLEPHEQFVFKINIKDLKKVLEVFRPFPALGMQLLAANHKN